MLSSHFRNGSVTFKYDSRQPRMQNNREPLHLAARSDGAERKQAVRRRNQLFFAARRLSTFAHILELSSE